MAKQKSTALECGAFPMATAYAIFVGETDLRTIVAKASCFLLFVCFYDFFLSPPSPRFFISRMISFSNNALGFVRVASEKTTRNIAIYRLMEYNFSGRGIGVG
jgi:hypothetical protein